MTKLHSQSLVTKQVAVILSLMEGFMCLIFKNLKRNMYLLVYLLSFARRLCQLSLHPKIVESNLLVNDIAWPLNAGQDCQLLQGSA